MYSNILFIFQWWIVFLGIGIIFLPLTILLFKNFFDRGYIFSKVLGYTILSYIVFLVGILHILKFNNFTIFLFIWIFFLINIYLIKKRKLLKELKNKLPIFILEEILFLIALIFWSFVRMHEPSIHGLEKYMDFGFINSILRAEYFPPQDMWFPPFSINYYYFGHFITAFLTKLSNIPSQITFNLMLSTIFAFTFTCTFSIGANLIKLISKSQTSKKDFVNRFGHGGSYRRSASSDADHNDTSSENDTDYRLTKKGVGNYLKFKSSLKILLGGLLTAFLVTFAGNIHTIYTFFKPYVNEKPQPFWELPFSLSTFPNSYWYPNATRFIHNTIHEFPIYSFVVSDLHGHVLDIPVVLLTIAILLSLLYHNVILKPKGLKDLDSSLHQTKFGFVQNDIFRVLLLAFLLAIMYMTNAWDGIIYFLLSAFVFGVLIFKNCQVDFQPKDQRSKIKNQRCIENLNIGNSLKIVNCKLRIYRWLFYVFILGIVFIIFTLPFQLTFKPFVSGIGVLCAPDFLTNIGKIGPFLFEKDHCQHSPWWQLMILHGFFYFWVISFIVWLFNKAKTIQNSKFKVQNYSSKFKIFNFKLRFLTFNFELLTVSDIFVLILIVLSTLLIIVPEFIYAKDIYPAHYRANTMFKLVYQSFIMLSISSAYIILRIIPFVKNKIFTERLIKKVPVLIYLIIAVFLFFLVSIYPNFAISSYYGDLFKNDKKLTLDGTVYLKNLYSTDYEAILWINKNIKGSPVILEAQGDSYTDYARVSSNTGLPTVLGWTVHEWLWRGTYDIPAPRIPDVQNLYETEDLTAAKNLIKKYKVEYVFVGDLERQKYPKMNDAKFKMLGTPIYQNGQTKIYKIDKF